jgi:hypothetical protein
MNHWNEAGLCTEPGEELYVIMEQIPLMLENIFKSIKVHHVLLMSTMGSAVANFTNFGCNGLDITTYSCQPKRICCLGTTRHAKQIS